MNIEHLLSGWAARLGLPKTLAGPAELLLILLLILLAAVFARSVLAKSLVRFIEFVFKKSRNKWDDALMQHDFPQKAGALVPVLVIYVAADFLLRTSPAASEFIKRLALTLFVLAGLRIFDAVLKATLDIYKIAKLTTGSSLRSYLDALSVLGYVMAIIFIIAIITGKSPWGIFSILGGFTVVLMLIFKDTILGFVASLRLTAMDMVRIGDWIEMPAHGADGDVVDLSIHTVKVQNWDKTITTIPTYDLVAKAFKNWRGMAQSGGRRIKRALLIDMNSIRFCDDAMLANFSKFHLLEEYVTQKQLDIVRYNRDRQVDESLLINGRRQTNIGVFRAYVRAYLRNNPAINQDMTFLVRQLQPTAEGLPLEIYVFSADKVWANYEAIQADIFDHLLAAAPQFGLRIFQNPSGYDFRKCSPAPHLHALGPSDREGL